MSHAINAPVAADTHCILDCVQEDNSSWKHAEFMSGCLIGNFCVVRYDGKPFPGKFLKVDPKDNDAQAQCMTKASHNRFVWPVSPDIAWYDVSDILSIITKPKAIGRSGRHY